MPSLLTHSIRYQCWPAVARGAVLYGLQQETTRFVYVSNAKSLYLDALSFTGFSLPRYRSSRLTLSDACLPQDYGLRLSQPFSAFKHSGITTYQDPFDGNTKAGIKWSGWSRPETWFCPTRGTILLSRYVADSVPMKAGSSQLP